MDLVSKKRILLLVTNSYAAMNAIHSGLIKPLATEFDIYILSNLIGETELATINRHFNISLNLINATVVTESILIKSLRHLEKWFFFAFFKIETQEIKDKQKGTVHRLMALAALRLIDLFGMKLFILKRLRKKIISLSAEDPTLDQLCSYDFSGVISTSPLDIRENAIVNFLQKFRVRSLATIISWDNLTSKGIINANHDYVLVWNEVMKQEYDNFYSPFAIPNQQVCITGIPRFDIYFQELPSEYSRQEFNKRFKINESDRIILFTTSALVHFPNQTDILKHLIDYVFKQENIRIIVRCHASDNYELYQQYASNSSVQIWHTDNILTNMSVSKWMPDLTILHGLAEMIRYCDVCINVASTIRLEAAACDKPGISIAYDGDLNLPFERSVQRFYSYSHQLPLNKLEVDKMVYSKSQLFEALDEVFHNSVQIENTEKIQALTHHLGPFAVGTTMNHIRQWLT